MKPLAVNTVLAIFLDVILIYFIGTMKKITRGFCKPHSIAFNFTALNNL